ncbi:hypothetical protein RG47T_2615 [Mucilaginibacter polytrichastri]|uniref:Uncharacterized protein n=1 Tax=Mucilaginibacter polytrichastri TaxID=1302689 RepID=A0A1Q5ZZI3_9SPHI|nr:hypothetical protein RG47T_2615 [Mucilaginibacter polytrichastri]
MQMLQMSNSREVLETSVVGRVFLFLDTEDFYRDYNRM